MLRSFMEVEDWDVENNGGDEVDYDEEDREEDEDGDVSVKSWNPGFRTPIAIENDLTVISLTDDETGFSSEGGGSECVYSQ